MNPRLDDGLNSVNFCTSEVTLFEKKSRKVLISRRLNKLKNEYLKNFLHEILNYRSAGPLSVSIPANGTGTGTKRKILAGLEPGPKKVVPHISSNNLLINHQIANSYSNQDNNIQRYNFEFHNLMKNSQVHQLSMHLMIYSNKNFQFLSNLIVEFRK